MVQLVLAYNIDINSLSRLRCFIIHVVLQLNDALRVMELGSHCTNRTFFVPCTTLRVPTHIVKKVNFFV